MEKGILFNIQKFSIHDGPGIRTTVFFKGCPLRCQWCSNPESQLKKIQILNDQDKCTRCRQCVSFCQQKAISLVNNRIQMDINKCNGCLKCLSICPNHALSNEGEYKEIEDIVSLCLQDKDFYEESNGGVSISGGEGMSQPEFLKALVQELKKHSLHIAIETTGFVSHDVFKQLAPLFDLILFDIKHYDSNQHFLGTHVHNTIIIDNLKWAISEGLNILPRIPVIPSFNESIEDAKGFTHLMLSLGLNTVQLLPFHQFGEKKYTLLNREYVYINKKALYQEDLKAYQHIFLDKGIECFF